MVQVKKKQGPQERDFKKIKAKGYGKAKTKKKQNTIVTTLKTRPLMMPYQKVTDAARVDREEVTRRNLSLEELLAKLGHHNTKARRDALMGLRELVIQFPQVLHSRLGVVLPAVLEGLTRAGESEKTDSALVAVTRSVFAAVPQDKMMPHGGVIGAYLMSAFTHLRLQSRVLGLRVLDACLESCPLAVLHSLNEHQLLTSLAATLTNRFQSGLVASVAALRQRLWATIVQVQRYGSSGSAVAPGGALVTRTTWLPPMRTVYTRAAGARPVFDAASAPACTADLLAPLLMQELYEVVPGPDHAMIELLLESMVMCLNEAVPRNRLAQDCLQKALAHVVAHFPLTVDMSMANVRAAALLLGSGNEAWAAVAASPVAAQMLAQPTLDAVARALLLNSCQALWRSSPSFGSAAGLAMAEAFVALFRTRLSASTRVECIPCLEFLLSSAAVPDAIQTALATASAKCLWQCVASAAGNSAAVDNAAAGVLRALWAYVRRTDATELLTNLMVPFFSVQVGDRLHVGPFAKLSSQCQVLAVRLYACLDTQAPDALLLAFERALCDASTHDDAAVALVRVLHQSRRRLFGSIAEYLRFLSARVLLRGDASPLARQPRGAVAVCSAIRDAGLLDAATTEEQQHWLWGKTVPQQQQHESLDADAHACVFVVAPLVAAHLRGADAVLLRNALLFVAVAADATPDELWQLVPRAALQHILMATDGLGVTLPGHMLAALANQCATLLPALAAHVRICQEARAIDAIAHAVVAIRTVQCRVVVDALKSLPPLLISSAVSSCCVAMERQWR